MKENIRIGYGNYIANLGNTNEDIILLEGDLADSTCSDIFEDQHPERHFQMGIAEQNMVGVAAGLALEGKIPFVNTFAAFVAMRACEQVRTSVAYPSLNVKFVVSHSGLSAGSAGPTHHTLEDIAIMRSIPNMTVLVPGDVLEVEQIIDASIKHQGPVYIRNSATDIKRVENKPDFQIGKASKIRDGDDVTIITTGIMMQRGLEASIKLDKEHNIKARLLQMASIKPIDENAIIDASNETKFIVTVEEHNILGGLGGAVSEIVSSHGGSKVIRIGINDHFSEIGTPEYLLEDEGLTSERIIETINNELKK